MRVLFACACVVGAAGAASRCQAPVAPPPYDLDPPETAYPAVRMPELGALIASALVWRGGDEKALAAGLGTLRAAFPKAHAPPS